MGYETREKDEDIRREERSGEVMGLCEAERVRDGDWPGRIG